MSSAGPSVNLAEDNLAAGCQVLSSRKGKHTSVCKGTWAGGSVTPGSRGGGAKPGGGCAGGLTSATLWPPTSARQTAHSAASDSQLRLLQSEMATLPGATIPGRTDMSCCYCCLLGSSPQTFQADHAIVLNQNNVCTLHPGDLASSSSLCWVAPTLDFLLSWSA